VTKLKEDLVKATRAEYFRQKQIDAHVTGKGEAGADFHIDGIAVEVKGEGLDYARLLEQLTLYAFRQREIQLAIPIDALTADGLLRLYFLEGVLASVVDVQRGGKKDTIVVTYQWEGLYSTEDIEKKERPVAMQFFALEDFDPEDAFVSFLPGIVEGDTFFKRESGNDRIQEQKRFYSGHFHIKGLIMNLRINDLITRLQRTRVLVHYSYLSAFTHPTRKAINFGEELRSTMARPANIEHLILLYVAKFHELLLSSVIDFYSEVNPKSQLTVEKSLVARLKIATQDLWFTWDEPTDYDKFDSEGRKEMVKQMTGETVDPGLVLYYTNPLKRLVSLGLFQRSRPKPIPSWVQEILKKARDGS